MNYVIIRADECKGCRLCVDACPKHCMIIGSDINTAGYQYAGFKSDTCTACGICYYICPEPEALTVVQGDKEGANE